MQPELIADCVHCGFCLPACPTYSLWHEEMDSPRGRIHLMGSLVDGTMPLTDTVVEHFDRCLGCMACVPACPSGVQYDRLIETTRAHIEQHHRRTPGERLLRRLIFEIFPHRRRLRAALAFRRLPAPGAVRAACRRRTSVAQQRVAARAPAGGWAARRADGRLRAERRLRRRERRDRARARRRRLRRARAEGAELLRRAARARGTARRGCRARPHARGRPRAATT